MSAVPNNQPFYFQSLKGKKIKFRIQEQKIIDGLKPLIGGEWEGKIKAGCTVLRKDRNAVRIGIRAKLILIQGHYCIYCGLHEDHCGELEREHIASKGIKAYPQFVFEPENLCLACHHCNFELKKEFDTITKPSPTYKNNKFNIVHPYFDNFSDHIQFLVENGKALISKKPRSRKGKKTIDLFELDKPSKTTKRSGLLIITELKVDNKYDALLNSALKNKYIKKK